MSSRSGRASGSGWPFPIPMRGNEINEVLEGPSALFPIPMRGNEMTQVRGEVKPFQAFPIPMRGNESTLERLEDLWERRFQSP